MNVLLSFTGFHDPYTDSVVEGQKNTGPILSVLGSRNFDMVFLMGTPQMQKSTAGTVAAIEKRFGGVTVRVLDVPLKDPTDYIAIMKYLRKWGSQIQQDYPEARLYISISSGTPQMHACWLMLAASGEIPAVVLQSRPPQFVSDQSKLVREIDLTEAAFPEIHSAPPMETDSERDPSLFLESLGIIGSCEVFQKALERALNLAAYDINCLLTGETGTGKEVFADLIHARGKRGLKPLFKINCAAYPESLLDSQLFGHKRGAFTGAVADQIGKFEQADGGTLFLDEIGELPKASQSKLLRALECGEIEPLGSGKTKKVNVCVIAATNRNIKQAIKSGDFREDLYYRFKGQVNIPPLRERRSDIPKIAQHILKRWNQLHDKSLRISPAVVQALKQYTWPGNVRELIRVIEDSAIMAKTSTIQVNELQFEGIVASPDAQFLPDPCEGFSMEAYLKDVRVKLIEKALEIGGGNQAKASRLLGVTPQAVHKYVQGRLE